jgi:cation diffusion facilitator family transporter
MHVDDISPWQHGHRFETGLEASAERRTRAVVALTAAMMVTEIAAGTLFNSMALTADGWHMATHVGALGIATFAYSFARRHADDRRFAFGTGKVGALAAFSSAIILAVVAVLMAWESAHRLRSIQTIAFDQALVIAALGLAVNLVSALILSGGGHTHNHHGHEHRLEHGGDHRRDYNLRAAYLHVLADAFTSVLAIVALVLGKYFGWWWMDPIMGFIGAAVILNWSWSLIRRSGLMLIDAGNDRQLENEVRSAIEGDADNRLADLHLWQIGPGHWAAIVSVVTHRPQAADHYKRLLAGIHELSHATVEVHACKDAA